MQCEGDDGGIDDFAYFGDEVHDAEVGGVIGFGLVRWLSAMSQRARTRKGPSFTLQDSRLVRSSCVCF